MKIAIAGTGYAGLSKAILLVKHNKVFVSNITNYKVKIFKILISPFDLSNIENFLKSKKLNLASTQDLKLTILNLKEERDLKVDAHP